MQQEKESGSSKSIDLLTVFLLEHKETLKNMTDFAIFNLWTSSSEISIKDDTEVARCLSFIKNRNRLFEHEVKFKKLFLEGIEK